MTETIRFKATPTLKAALEKTTKDLGITPSEFLRVTLAQLLEYAEKHVEANEKQEIIPHPISCQD